MIGKVVGVALLGVVLIVAVGQLERFLGVDAFDRESVEVTLDDVTAQTGQGGSYVAGTSTDLSPSRFPLAFMNVMFRPFPWQATNAQALVAAAEATVLLGLFVLGWRRILNGARTILESPYVIVCACYTVLFVYGFSSFANFGILVRQRVQVLPFFLVLLAFPRSEFRGPARISCWSASRCSSAQPDRWRRRDQRYLVRSPRRTWSPSPRSSPAIVK